MSFNRLVTFTLLAALAVLAACGGQPTAQRTAAPEATTVSGGASTQPASSVLTPTGGVTIENCGQQVTYDKIPQRAVTNDVNITEIMLALGLQDRMAGMSGVGGRYTDKLAPEYQEVAQNIPIISDKYFTLEPLLGVNPDFVYAGWGYGFSEENGITPETLAEKDIASYVLEESCAQRGERPTSTIENTLFHDIRNIGAIFGVPERADALIAQYEKELAEITSQLPNDAALPVFLYDSGEQDVFTAGGNAVPTAIISAAGGANIFADLKKSWTTVGWEAIVERNPEFIVIVDYGEVTADQKQAFATNLPAMKDVPAIVNQRFAVLPYAAATPGPRNIAAVRTLAEAFYPESFGASAPTPVAASAASGGFPVTIENCGVTQTYAKAPARAVTMNQHATEVMLALGLQERMVGTAYLDDAILPEYQAVYAAIPALAEQYPSKEVLLAAQPDFVYGGFRSAFGDDAAGSREDLQTQGINSYLSTEYCSETAVTMDTVYNDIRNIGAVFGVSDRAEALITTMQEQIDSVRAKIPQGAAPQVFVYDSGEDVPFTSGGLGIANEIIALAGGENIFADLQETFGEPTWEEVVARDPNVILIFDYGDTSVEQKREFLLNNPALADVDAIKNQRFAVLPLSSVVAGVRNPTAIADVARALYPEAFR
jgi:iron complex transport system substrate-binding protein